MLNINIQIIEYKGQEEPAAQGQLYVEHVPLYEDVVLGVLNPKMRLCFRAIMTFC